MAELRELFEMTTKQAEPDLDSWKEQEQRQRRTSRNNRLGALAVAAAIGVVAVAVVVAIRVEQGTGTEPAIRPSPTPGTSAVPETDYLIDLDNGEMTPLPKSIVGTGTSGSADFVQSGYAVSPDGSRLAYVGSGNDGVKQVFVANVGGTGAEQVTNDRGAESPAWSPDGSRIAYVGSPGHNPGNIFVLDLATGESTQLTFHTGSTGASLESPSFAADGSSIVYSVSTWDGPCCPPQHNQIRIVPITGGRSVRLVGGDGIGANDGKLSPDGSLLSYNCDPADGQLLCLAKADGSDERVLVHGNDFLVSHSWSPDGTRIAYWGLHSHDVFVVDVATGAGTYVAEGAFPVWLDDHILIVRIDRCYDPALGARSPNCSG
jgi:Tol biopolymer transport system component